MVGTSSAPKKAPAETGSLAYPGVPFSQRSDRYSRRLFTLSFCLVLLMVVGIAGLLTWSWYGTIEESVPGSGQIIPTDKIRRIMSPSTAKVKKVYMHEDQLVHAGDILVEMDSEDDQVESVGMMSQMDLLQQDSQALRAATGHGRGAGLGSLRGAWLSANDDAFSAQRAQAEMGVQKAEHEYQQLVERVKQQAEQLKSSEEQLLSYQTLFQEDGISEHELREYELKVIQLRGDLATTKEAVESQRLSLLQSKTKMTEIRGTFQSGYLDRLAENERRIADLNMQRRRVHLDEKHRYVYAPIEGYVNQQSVHGPGEMIASGQVLCSLVPAHSNLIAEIKVANKDLSYVYPSQTITLHLEAFPSQHFKKLTGIIMSMSPSSQEMEAPSGHGEQPFYILRVKPDRQVMISTQGKSYPLRSGMTVSADIITQHKSILSFFVEPIQLHLDRAFRDPSGR